MKLTSKLNYDKIVDKLFFIYICFFYAFPYQILKVELALLILLLPKLKKIKINIFLGWSIIYILFLLFSTIYSIDPGNSLIKTFQILKSLIFANILINSISTKKEIEKIYQYFIISGFVLITRILFIFPIGELGRERIHIPGLFNANDIGFKLSISLLFVLYFVFLKKKKSIYFILELVILYIFIIFTGSRTAFLFGSLEIILLALLSVRNKAKLLLRTFIFFLFFILFYDEIINRPIIYDILGKRIESLFNVFMGKGEIDNSSLIRINMIKDGINYFFEKPFLGYGIDSYRYMSYYETYSHNNYIELLVSLGVFGTILYYFIYGYIFIKVIKIKTENINISFLLLKNSTIPLIVDLGTVSYYERYNIFILAFSFFNVTVKNKLFIKNDKLVYKIER